MDAQEGKAQAVKKDPKISARQDSEDLFKMAAQASEEGNEAPKAEAIGVKKVANQEKIKEPTTDQKPKAQPKQSKTSALASVVDYTGPMGDNDLSELGEENVQLKSNLRFTKHHLAKMHPHRPSKKSDELIMLINSNKDKYSWEANTCMLTKTHYAYPGEDECNSMVQLSDDVFDEDVVEPTPKPESTASLAQAAKATEGSGPQSFAESWSKKYPDTKSIPDSVVPAEFDLRNVQGTDYTNPVRDQAQCGSCYAMSFVQTVESRLKYKTGKSSP